MLAFSVQCLIVEAVPVRTLDLNSKLKNIISIAYFFHFPGKNLDRGRPSNVSESMPEARAVCLNQLGL